MDKLMKDVMIHGVESYILYIAKLYDTPLSELSKSVEDWIEDEFGSTTRKKLQDKRCGASDCTHNFQFKCTLPKINTDKTSKCLTFKQKL